MAGNSKEKAPDLVMLGGNVLGQVAFKVLNEEARAVLAKALATNGAEDTDSILLGDAEDVVVTISGRGMLFAMKEVIEAGFFVVDTAGTPFQEFLDANARLFEPAVIPDNADLVHDFRPSEGEGTSHFIAKSEKGKAVLAKLIKNYEKFFTFDGETASTENPEASFDLMERALDQEGVDTYSQESATAWSVARQSGAVQMIYKLRALRAVIEAKAQVEQINADAAAGELQTYDEVKVNPLTADADVVSMFLGAPTHATFAALTEKGRAAILPTLPPSVAATVTEGQMEFPVQIADAYHVSDLLSVADIKFVNENGNPWGGSPALTKRLIEEGHIEPEVIPEGVTAPAKVEATA